jgi:hypothetical protein
MDRRYFPLLLALLTLAGCMQSQLRKNSVGEAQVVAEMEQQQVLDNLAMFVCNYNSMPYFSYPNQTSTSMQDQASIAGTAVAGRPGSSSFGVPFMFNTLGLSGGDQRTAVEGLVVTPVNDPRRLEWMRCAYQLALRNCRGGEPSENCPDCQTRFAVFYTGDPNGNIRDKANGTVTSECLKTNFCWLHVGCKKCAPKPDACNLVGSYCGVYVWVCPEGRDELTKLTMAILDYAVNNPPAAINKQVVYYIDEYGLPTNQKQAVGTVTATVAVTEANSGILHSDSAEQARIEQQIDYRLRMIQQRLTEVKDPMERKLLMEEELALQSKLDFLHEQLRGVGLKEKFRAQPSSGGPNGILLFNQIQQTLAPQ